MVKKRLFWGVIGLVLVAALLMGCGSSNAPTTTVPTVPATTSGATVKPTAAPTTAPTSAATPTSAAQPITFVASTVFSETYPYVPNDFYRPLKEIEEKSGGRIKFKTYTQGQLFGGSDEFAALANGAVDFLPIWFPPYNTKDDPVFGFAKVPFLFNGVPHFVRGWDAGVSDIFNRHLAKWDAIPLNVLPLMESVGLAYKGDVPRVPGDIRGKKVRCADPYEKNLYEYLGGAGVVTTSPEQYIVLQRGIVDMAISEHSGNLSYKTYEVTNGFIDFNMSVPTMMGLVNKKKFESLSPDLQKIVKDAFKSAQDNWLQIFSQAEKDSMNKIKDLKPSYIFTTATPEEKAQWAQASMASSWKFLSQLAGVDGDQIIRIANATKQ